MRDRFSRNLAVITFVAMLTWCMASSGFSGSARASVDDLQVGQTVTVEGKSSGARTIHASEIEIQQAPQEDKLKGRIQNIDSGANSLVVLGTKVFADRDAQIAARDGSAIPFSSLQKGWMVKARGSLQEEGALHASEIKVSREEAPDEAEVEGRVQSIDKARSTMTVTGLTIRLTPTTKIKFD
jgi:cytochrome c-type biogenesis protein CcmE